MMNMAHVIGSESFWKPEPTLSAWGSGGSDEEGLSAEAISHPQKTEHPPSSSELAPSPHLSGQATIVLSGLIQRLLIRNLFPSFKYGAILALGPS